MKFYVNVSQLQVKRLLSFPIVVCSVESFLALGYIHHIQIKNAGLEMDSTLKGLHFAFCLPKTSKQMYSSSTGNQ